jgi:hypothetical protein
VAEPPLARLDLVYLYFDGFHLKVRIGGKLSAVPLLASWASSAMARRSWSRKWSKACPGVVKSLEEARDELLTMYRYRVASGRPCVLRASSGCFSSSDAASKPAERERLALPYGLLASGHIRFRKLDGSARHGERPPDDRVGG